MNRPSRPRAIGGLMALVCAVALAVSLAACGGSSPHSLSGASIAGSSTPGLGDVAICQDVNKATAALAAKQNTNWRIYMIQIGSMAGSAHDATVRRLAQQVQRVTTGTTTTTPSTAPKARSRSKSKLGAGFTFSSGLNELLYYEGLKSACAKVPAS